MPVAGARRLAPSGWRVEAAEPISRPSGVMTAASWMLRQMGFVSTLDALLPWEPKQCKLSPGTRLLALTLCVPFDRAALCNVQQVLARQDLSIPFGSAPQAADFNKASASAERSPRIACTHARTARFTVSGGNGRRVRSRAAARSRVAATASSGFRLHASPSPVMPAAGLRMPRAAGAER